jgi:hypothetical protein
MANAASELRALEVWLEQVAMGQIFEVLKVTFDVTPSDAVEFNPPRTTADLTTLFVPACRDSIGAWGQLEARNPGVAGGELGLARHPPYRTQAVDQACARCRGSGAASHGTPRLRGCSFL